ncbi:MAG: hypothetical protein IT476_06650 [Rhodanobacteraceae bacterium]|nr:hypothetical protein [Rhodanobacteraceae bacterium]
MNETVTRQDIVDTEHLRLLAFGYVFSAIMSALMSLLGLLYAGIGFVMSHFFAEAALNATNPDKIPPEALGTIVSVFGGVFFVVLMALALLKFYAASCIRRRKSRLFCQIIAGISCLAIPYGTLLGVLTFIVLGRANVVRWFDAGANNSAAS